MPFGVAQWRVDVTPCARVVYQDHTRDRDASERVKGNQSSRGFFFGTDRRPDFGCRRCRIFSIHATLRFCLTALSEPLPYRVKK
jgi:hypothetical protein